MSLSKAELDELSRKAALGKLTARGFAIEPASFYARATVVRQRDGGVRVVLREET